MQPVLERGYVDKPLTFDVGLIQLSFIPVCSPNTCSNCAEDLLFIIMAGLNARGLQSKLLITPLSQ